MPEAKRKADTPKRKAWYGVESVEIVRDYKVGGQHLFNIRRPCGTEVFDVRPDELRFPNDVEQIYVWKDPKGRERQVVIAGQSTNDDGEVLFTICLPSGEVRSGIPQDQVEIRKIDPFRS